MTGCGGWDSNPRSLGYEPNDLATGLPRIILINAESDCQFGICIIGMFLYDYPQ